MLFAMLHASSIHSARIVHSRHRQSQQHTFKWISLLSVWVILITAVIPCDLLCAACLDERYTCSGSFLGSPRSHQRCYEVNVWRAGHFPLPHMPRDRCYLRCIGVVELVRYGSMKEMLSIGSTVSASWSSTRAWKGFRIQSSGVSIVQRPFNPSWKSHLVQLVNHVITW